MKLYLLNKRLLWSDTYPYNIILICEVLPPFPLHIAEAKQFLAKLIMTLGIKSDVREGKAIIIR